MGKRRGVGNEDAASGRSQKVAKATNGKKGQDTPDAEALQRVEPKPYFPTITLGAKDGNFEYLNGILSYNVHTGKFDWNRQSFTLHDSGNHVPFAVEGLICCQHLDDLEQQAVYSIHTKTWHKIPPSPEESEFQSALGMTVDTSEKPYSFKLFQGSLDTKTQVYDSKSGSWSTKSSVLGTSAEDSLKKPPRTASCMCSNGCLYLSRGNAVILKYSIENDSWTTLGGPPMVEDDDHNTNTLGAYAGRIFTTRQELGGGGGDDDDGEEKKNCVVVWELVDETKNEWVEYARIAGEPYEWLSECDFGNYGPHIYDELGLVTCYCNEYLFIYNWAFGYARADGFVLFNLATKECTEVDLPCRAIKTKAGRDYDYEDEYEDEDEEDEEEGEGDQDEDFKAQGEEDEEEEEEEKEDEE